MSRDLCKLLYRAPSSTQVVSTATSGKAYHVWFTNVEDQGLPLLVSLPSSVLPRTQTHVLLIRSKAFYQRAIWSVEIVWISEGFSTKGITEWVISQAHFNIYFVKQCEQKKKSKLWFFFIIHSYSLPYFNFFFYLNVSRKESMVQIFANHRISWKPWWSLWHIYFMSVSNYDVVSAMISGADV